MRGGGECSHDSSLTGSLLAIKIASTLHSVRDDWFPPCFPWKPCQKSLKPPSSVPLENHVKNRSPPPLFPLKTTSKITHTPLRSPWKPSQKSLTPLPATNNEWYPKILYLIIASWQLPYIFVALLTFWLKVINCYLQESSIPLAVERTTGLFDIEGSMFQAALILSSALLLVFVIAGLLWELVKRLKIRRMVATDGE